MTLLIDESWFVRPVGVPEETTAGGIVVRFENNCPLVAIVKKERRKFTKYSLPKGHIENGETLEETARREIYEETGIADLQLVLFLTSTGRLNRRKSAWKVNHFFFFVTEQVECVPLEDDKETLWFPIDNLPELFWRDQTRLVQQYRPEILTKVA